jgi:uncharacterized protein YndB with AHSA1/START domain
MCNLQVARRRRSEVRVSDRIEREQWLEASPEEVWEAVIHDGWLADEVDLDLRPGGDAEFRSPEETKTGWVEEVAVASRLAFWWAADGEPATRVELTLSPEGDLTRLRVVETRPLDVLDLVATPLPGFGRFGGRTYGPALVAA